MTTMITTKHSPPLALSALLVLLVSPLHAFLPRSLPFRATLFLQATPSFPHSQQPPFLAVVTEPDACETDQRVSQTLAVLKQAISRVDLISVRVDPNSEPERVIRLVKELVTLAEEGNTSIVVTSDWVEAAIQGGAHGIHVKESHRSRIPQIRQQFIDAGLPSPLIGTSAHSIDSAVEALVYQPDYFFVGTCYVTQTHPEKSASDLEGPSLPGQIAREINSGKKTNIPVLAIGGIHEGNCAEPVQLGASGVATIRAVLQAKDPAATVKSMHESMAMAYEKA